MKSDKLRVTEIFYSIQGESTHSGHPCVFVRLSRCNLRCNWCDTPYSFKGGDEMSLEEILERVDGYGCDLVEITGGEPLLQPGVFPLMTRLCDRDYQVLVETSGSIDIEPVDDRVKVIMDLKAPGSGEVDKNRWENLAHLADDDEIKFVLLDRGDFEWAVQVCRERDLFEGGPVHFSPVHDELNAQTLASWILEERLPVRLNLQIHKFLGVE